MDALGLAQAGVLGNSLGGIVASRLAAEHPERVSKLCMIGGIGLNLFTTFRTRASTCWSSSASSRLASGSWRGYARWCSTRRW
jgi:pimeloyl-ACP methyl ester carboxylesterase